MSRSLQSTIGCTFQRPWRSSVTAAAPRERVREDDLKQNAVVLAWFPKAFTGG